MKRSLKTITKITTQQKVKNRYNIFLDDVYACSVAEDVLIQFQLRKGMQLSEAELKQIQNRDAIERYYLAAIHYVSYRMRSIQEIDTYLRKKDLDEQTVQEIIERLIKEGILNDAAFSRAYVADKMNFTTKGPQLIAQELREKGVAPSIVQQAVATYSREQQFDTALKWAKKEQRKTNRHAFKKRNEQLKYKLMQKGFPNEIASMVVEEVKGEIDTEEEFALLKIQADKLWRRYSKKYTGFELEHKLKAGLYNRGFSSESINEYVAKLDE